MYPHCDDQMQWARAFRPMFCRPGDDRIVAVVDKSLARISLVRVTSPSRATSVCSHVLATVVLIALEVTMLQVQLPSTGSVWLFGRMLHVISYPAIVAEFGPRVI